MPRIARTVIAGLPHHITQRGNRRCDVFFDDEDRQTYLAWLHHYCQHHHVDVPAYCLMTNHIHLVLTAQEAEGLQRVLKPLHMRYAQGLIGNGAGRAIYGRVDFSHLPSTRLTCGQRSGTWKPTQFGPKWLAGQNAMRGQVLPTIAVCGKILF